MWTGYQVYTNHSQNILVVRTKRRDAQSLLWIPGCQWYCHRGVGDSWCLYVVIAGKDKPGKCHHVDENFVTDSTVSCHIDSFRWRKFRPHDDISVLIWKCSTLTTLWLLVCTGTYHSDKFWCIQWRHFHHRDDIYVSVHSPNNCAWDTAQYIPWNIHPVLLRFVFIDHILMTSWWRHQMETFSALLAFCAGKSPVTGKFPSQRPVTRSFDVSFDLCLNKRLCKQSRCRWFETPSRSLWRHCNVVNSYALTHWGRLTYLCVSKLTTIGSDNGLSPDRRQAIIWTNAGIWLIGPIGTNFNEIFIETHTFSFTKILLKMSSGKWRSFCSASMC